MAEAMRETRLPLSAPAPAGVPARAVNGAALRWTAGPDELRLPECEEVHVPLSTRQLVAIVDCLESLRRHWSDRLDVLVSSDQFIYWDRDYHPKENPANPPLAPDLYVVFGVPDRHRRSYVVWEAPKPPDFVLEVVSPSTRRRDEKEKPCTYAKIGVPEFFLYHPEREPESALLGFKLCGGRGGKYEPLPMERLPGGAIGVRSGVLGLYLCPRKPRPRLRHTSLRWYDPAASKFLPTSFELARGKRRAEARAEALAARAAAAEAKAAESAAKLAELQALVEKTPRG